MIPKKIHYCWFGHSQLPAFAQKCISSWKKCCPDYDIIEWNEQNYDIDQAPLYVRQAYQMKKYAYVTDYVRLQIIYENGGIYFDTDVELIKPIDNLLEYSAFFGADTTCKIATGLGFGASAGHPLVKELMASYENRSFFKEDGTLNASNCPYIDTFVFNRHGYYEEMRVQILGKENNGVLILPAEFMDPVVFKTGKLRKTSNTISIHWYTATGLSEKNTVRFEPRKKQLRRERRERRMDWIKTMPNKVLRMTVGNSNYERIKHYFKGK